MHKLSHLLLAWLPVQIKEGEDHGGRRRRLVGFNVFRRAGAGVSHGHAGTANVWPHHRRKTVPTVDTKTFFLSTNPCHRAQGVHYETILDSL